MACTNPLTAYQCANGDVVFVERRRHDITRTLSLPCGQCMGCRLERSRVWAVRCVHEAKMHERNSFVTLTYDEKHFPDRGMLLYRDFQLFMKRLRKEKGPVRFYMCGEYGPLNWRPHFHACLFGVDFDDKVFWGKGEGGFDVYRSAELERLWGQGFCTVGEVGFESAAYTARYCVQKVTGDAADRHYARRDSLGEYMLPAEFNHMSLKPGIGANFMKRWKTDIYPNDYVVIRGKEMKPPKYYDKLFKRDEPEVFDQLQWAREMEGRSKYEDNTPECLAVKDQVTKARLKLLRRTI